MEESRIVNYEYVERSDTYNLTLGGFGTWHHCNRRNKLTVKDKDGNTMSVSVDDPKYLSGELVSFFKDKVPVKDKDGNTFQVDKNDPRYISGELVSTSKGMVTVKDKEGNTSRVSKYDYKYLNGELKFICSGRIKKNKKQKNIKKQKNPSNNIKCPHCKKEGNIGAMKRWHFDNCKLNVIF